MLVPSSSAISISDASDLLAVGSRRAGIGQSNKDRSGVICTGVNIAISSGINVPRRTCAASSTAAHG